MQKSSINIQPVKGNSEAHNLRKTKLDYVFSSKTHLNQSVVMDEIGPTRQRLEELYKEKTGQKMQKKATPIREGVVIVGKKNNMKDLVKMSGRIEEELGIKTMQIHLHEDEGHQDRDSGEFKQNRHAHIVFNWINEETGKSVKLNKQHMAQMQTIVAESLGLQRGQSSDKKHLHSMEFKAQAEFKNSINYQVQASEAKKNLRNIKLDHKAENVTHNIKKNVSQAFKRLGRVDEASKLKESLDVLKMNKKELQGSNINLTQKLERSVPLSEYEKIQNTLEDKERELESLRKSHKEKQEQIEIRDNSISKILLGFDKGRVEQDDFTKFYEENGFREKWQKELDQKQNKLKGPGR